MGEPRIKTGNWEPHLKRWTTPQWRNVKKLQPFYNCTLQLYDLIQVQWGHMCMKSQRNATKVEETRRILRGMGERPIQTGNWQFQIGEEGEVSGAQAWNAELWLKQWGDKKVLPVDRGNSIWQPFNKYCPSTFLPSLETFMKIYSQKGDGALPHLCRPHFLKGGKGKDDAREGLMCWWHGLGKGRGAVTQTPD